MNAWDWLTSAATSIAQTACSLTTSTQTFSFVTTSTYLSDAATVSNRNVFRFLLGTLPNGVSVYIDDVVIMEKQAPTITFTQDLSGLLTGQNTVALTSSSNFTSSSTPAASAITYASDNNAVVSVSGSTLTVVGAGTCNVTASQAANSYYYAATPVSVPVTVTARPTLTVSGSQTQAVLNNANYDVTIDNTGTLTMGANKTVHNLTVNSGGKITFDAVTPYTLTVTGNVLFKSDATSSFSSFLGAGGMSVSGSVNYDKTMDGTQWYFMSFPCDINMTTTPIKKADGTALTVGTDLLIKYYDGASRAVNLGASSNWKSMAAGSTLNKYQGYVFGLPNGQGPYDVRFPLTNALVTSEAANNISVVAYGDGTSVNATNKGWNLVGYPYISKYTATGANVNYMTIFEEGYYYATLATADAGVLSPFTAYFVQADAALAASQVTFAVGSRQQVRSSVATDLSDRIRINVVTPTGVDNTTLIIDENQSPSYQIGQDMVKWPNPGTTKPQLYTVLNGDNYAYNALPIESVQNLSLGLYSNTAGECSISVDASQAPGISQLLLIDSSNGVITDLMTSDYHFKLSAGTNNTRFSINAQRIATQTKITDTTFNSPRVLMSHGKLAVDGISSKCLIQVFDTQGRQIVRVETTKDIEIPLDPIGVYSVQVQTAGKKWVHKLVSLK